MDNTHKAANRRTIRLQNYDYSQPGFYFVTICTSKKKRMFGEIVNDEMHPNEVGKVIQSTWNTLPERFPCVELDEYIIMPNHIHGVIVIEETSISAPRVSHSSNVPERFKRYMHANSAPPPHPVGRDKPGPYDDASRLHHASALPALGEIVRTFKAVSTHDIRLSEKPNFAWQTNYYEHIIRNDKDLDRIREYIINNPAHWEEDSLNIKEGSILGSGSFHPFYQLTSHTLASRCAKLKRQGPTASKSTSWMATSSPTLPWAQWSSKPCAVVPASL